MKIKFSQSLISLFILFSISINITYGQNFTNLTQSTDSTYGYSDKNPLKLKKDDPVGGIKNSKEFLKGLKTSDGQNLTVISRSGVVDPNYKEPPGGILASLGDGGILDKYELVTSVKKDTIILYIDIYHKDKLFIPVGLKYEKP